jgi:hypothetical protein
LGKRDHSVVKESEDKKWICMQIFRHLGSQ